MMLIVSLAMRSHRVQPYSDETGPDDLGKEVPVATDLRGPTSSRGPYLRQTPGPRDVVHGDRTLHPREIHARLRRLQKLSASGSVIAQTRDLFSHPRAGRRLGGY